MQNGIIQSACPNCKSVGFTAVSQPVSEFKVWVKETIFIHPAFSVNRCNNCFLFFKSHIPDYETLNRYYHQLDNGYEDLDFLFPTDKHTIEEINKSGSALRVLDFGCGTGRILNQLANDTEKFGTELNEQSIRIAESRGIKIIDDEALKNYTDFFDVILLTDVYEHLYHPFEMLSTLKKYIRPGGKMILVTGNSEAIAQKKYAAGYWYFQLFSHLQMLNVSHSKWLAENLGFGICKMIKCSHYDTALRLKVKHLLAIGLFALYKRTTSAGLWNNPRLKFVKTWTYPSFDSSNRDHLIIILKKDQ